MTDQQPGLPTKALPERCPYCDSPSVTSGSGGKFADLLTYRCGNWRGTTHDGQQREPIQNAQCSYVRELRELLREGAHHMYRVRGRESIAAYERWRERVRAYGIEVGEPPHRTQITQVRPPEPEVRFVPYPVGRGGGGMRA